ncbi:caspase family protein [Dactylosporangium sp. AC04546]|uniref:caspase family protein n=1 Tax=Dactylosporangium sp. AC04546 TaxID=2862460 RepID=UPI001EDF1BF2|nr:caspase family protein [Dactylosporangium sp. AC04546]WVK85628.1 caspase family protein [Dactylosporangium sp. AC04546]
MKRALCIGINDYPGIENDLSGCRNDAEDWAAELTTRGFAVRKLLDSAASGAAIRTAIRELLTTAQPDDAVVITYSGHGTWVPDEDGDEPDHRDEAICPHDIALNGPLLDDELHALFAEALDGVRTVLISDSCHSGTLTRSTPRPGTRFLPPSAFLHLPSSGRAVPALRVKPSSKALLLSGCKDAEYSYDATFDGRPNGAFTHVALEALRSLPEDATYRDWLRSIRRSLPSEDYPQSPALQATSTQHLWPLLS